MFIQTSRLPWVLWRDAVAADDAPITDFKSANWPTTGTIDLRDAAQTDGGKNALKDAVSVVVAAWGTAGATTSYKIYGRCRGGGPIMLLLTGVMTTGTQACTVHPITGATLASNYWVGTMTATGGILSSSVSILDTGNNMICLLKFDTLIWKELFMEVDIGTMAAFNCMITGC